MVKPQQRGSCGPFNFAGRCRSDIHPMRCRGAKSFVDDLVLSRGVVLSRAATLLRSIETKPFDSKICPLWTDASSFGLACLFGFAGGYLLSAFFLFVPVPAVLGAPNPKMAKSCAHLECRPRVSPLSVIYLFLPVSSALSLCTQHI